MLCERDDLASGTSSASSKLIHGGLRYLESFEFRLVRDSLAEREVLLGIAPHLVRPMRFVLPVSKGMRPAWMLRIGLFLYDNLAKRAILPGTKTLDLRACPQGEALQPHLTRGFEYSDCWVDDLRMTVLNAVDAAERGARISTRLECLQLERHRDHWRAKLQDSQGINEVVQARTIVNASGPWVEQTLRRMGHFGHRRKLRLVKGSHIVVPKLFEGDHAYIFQTADNRVVFALPFGAGQTLVGTTEEDWKIDQGKPEISDGETRYLCDAANGYFARRIGPEDVIWSYSGVRPLFNDESESATTVTRDYVFNLDVEDGAPVLSVFGGKLTTYRKLAEQAVDKILPLLEDEAKRNGKAWTAKAPLPGGDFGGNNLDQQVADYQARWPWLPADQARRLTSAYGTRVEEIIGGALSAAELGKDFGAGLTAAEIDYLRTRELARTADDIIWRRSKLGLQLSGAQIAAIEDFLAQD